MEPKVYLDPQRKRILWTGIIVALAVFAAIVMAILSVDRTMKSSGAFTGKIIAMEFTPEPAREITVGAGGLRGTDVAGEYLLKVETPDKSRVFNVWVDRTVYEARKMGDDFYVIPTP
ncbi:MAG: hypothetical protein JHD33_04390 [Chthoniobacterales bacterium]|nr:hypothetical protein [Chthoniobacterales bacterium]